MATDDGHLRIEAFSLSFGGLKALNDITITVRKGEPLAIIFKATKAFNLGLGGFVQLGAFVLYLFLVQAGLPFYAAFPLFLASSVLVGLLADRLAFRPLIGQPLWASVIVAIAFLPFLAGLVTMVWGSAPRRYEPVLPPRPPPASP